MLLRRFIEHFKDQNWTAIGLDFLIVVAGVFIGLQVSNLNELRKEHGLERQYLERIYADIENTLAGHDESQEWNDTRLRQQALILNSLRAGVLREEDREDFENGLALFGFVSGISAKWGTVNELRSSGSMNIIRDVSLRGMILAVDGELERREGIDDNFFGSIYAFREAIGDRYGVRNFDEATRTVALDYDFDALANDTAFINILSQIDYLDRFKAGVVDEQLQEFRALRDELAARGYSAAKG